MKNKKKWIVSLCALSLACGTGAAALRLTALPTANAAGTALNLQFTDTMDSAYFKAPASFYGWKVQNGALAPDNTIAENNQVAYLDQAIALNESKYISLDFYASACQFDLMLLPYAETVNPWATGVGVHCMQSGWIRLDTYIDANTGWLGDYTGIGSGADGLEHSLEIISDGATLDFYIDGAAAFADVAIPANSVQLLLRAPKNSYVDDLYIASVKPAQTVTGETKIDFDGKTDANDFTALALDGWTGDHGKFRPAQEGALYNASATKLNKAIPLTGKSYVSFDFYSTAATFDVGLLDSAAENMWSQNSLFIHLPFSDGATIGVNNYVDCTVGTYYDGASVNCVDGKPHTLELFIEDGKVSYSLDGAPIYFNGGTTSFNAPEAASANLVFRAVGTASYIDNLYIADSAPARESYGFATSKDESAFLAWNSVGWEAKNGGLVAKTNWASVQYAKKLDLTKDRKITFDVFLSSQDTDKQFNVAFVSDENLPTASTVGAGIGFSFGSTLWLGTNLGRGGWIADVAANLYNDSWHSVTIFVENKKLSIAVDGVKYDNLTADIPTNEANLVMQSTSTQNALDNFCIGEEAGFTLKIEDALGNQIGGVTAQGEYALPTLLDETRGAFAGFIFNGAIYPAGAKINVESDGVLTAIFVNISMQEGASIRLSTPTGLRFTSEIDAATYEALKSANGATLGTLIAKADEVAQNGDYSALVRGNAFTHLDIRSTVGKTQGGNYVFNGVLASVKSHHYDWKFAARAYLEITYADGETAIFYTNGVTRSVSEVANAAFNERSAAQDETDFPYLTADGDFSPYTQDELTVLQSFFANNS